MQRYIRIYKWLLTACLLLGGMQSPAATFDRVSTPSAWTTKPALSEDVRPAYTFRSSSTVSPVVGYTNYTATPGFNPGGNRVHRMRQGDPWGDPEDDPIAVIPDPAPVGEPIILLLFALLYVAYKYRRKVKS